MLKIFRIYIVVILLIVMVGCSFVSKEHELSSSSVKGRIIQPSALDQGGNVLIVPFSAGTHAFSSEELDKSALIIVRGIQDGLQQSSSQQFRVIYDFSESDYPDLRIIGRIQRQEAQGQWKRYVGLKRKRFIEVEGKVLDDNDVLVATFHYSVGKPYVDISETNFLLQVGKDIGLFLIQSSLKE